MLVELTEAELMQAGMCAIHRRVSSILGHYNTNKHAKVSHLGTDFDGACAEIAFAKACKVYWDAGNRTFKAPDVAAMQIRSTQRETGRLIVRPNDDTEEDRMAGIDRVFILGIVHGVKVRLAGGIRRSRAIRDEWFTPATNGESACWWVPQDHLTPIPDRWFSGGLVSHAG